MVCRHSRRSACTGHRVKQLRAVSAYVFDDIFSSEENPNTFLSRCQHPPFPWLCILLWHIRKKPFHKIRNVRCVSVMARRMDHFVADEN